MAHPLPPLPYKYDALEPHYERATTLELHHGKHHQTYVDNLNKALEGHAALEQTSIEAILSDLSAVPSGIRTKVVNNGGGITTTRCSGPLWARTRAVPQTERSLR